MAQRITVHPETPQPRLIAEIGQALRQGAVILYPTDSVYAIGCDVTAKSAVQRVRRIKQLANDRPLTFICRDLSQAAHYVRVGDRPFKLMRELVPGPFTFLLPANSEVPRIILEVKRRTVGIRIPDNPVCQALLTELGNPIVSTSAHLQVSPDAPMASELGPDQPIAPAELFDQLERLVDLIVSVEGQQMRILGEEPDYHVTTILDLTELEPRVLRLGQGWEQLEALGLEVSGDLP
jgi:tRNA threonylcarbamoyl adenosine modification protein (Sua5/YciO/YrdC/YwlC family)